MSFTDASSDRPVQLYLDGTYRRGRARVLHNEDLLVKVWPDKKWTWKDERRASIAPNVDPALVLAIIICFDKVLTEMIASTSVAAPLVTAVAYEPSGAVLS